jgi:hypothetical protein
MTHNKVDAVKSLVKFIRTFKFSRVGGFHMQGIKGEAIV